MSGARRPRLALCPIGKFVFSHPDAMHHKAALQQRLREWGVDFVDLEGVLPDGMVRAHSHVDTVVRHFAAQQVDALFVPHCNFGTESAVGMIARKLAVPTLLWGPRDEAPEADGTRLRDSLCGMFASSKVLHKLGVRFSYIENCRLDEPPLRQGLDRFLRAVNVANVCRRGARIGLVGQRIDFFWTTIVNESELLERFRLEVLPIDMVVFIERVRQRVRENHGAYAKEAAQWRATSRIEGYADDEPLIRVLAVRDQLLAHVRDDGLDSFAMQDFMALVDAMGTYCFFANTLVADEVAASLESDVHGAISTLLLRRAMYDQEPAFLSDITVRHPTDPNGVLLWHAGAPWSMRHPEAQLHLGHHWILPSPLAGMPHFRLKDGPVTVARFDGDGGDYQLAIGQGETMPGPFTQNNYAWVKVDDWPRWERILMEGPFIHHAAMGYQHVGPALVEACKYIDGLRPVVLNHHLA
jgi:L-fucose isomerase-like protein